MLVTLTVYNISVITQEIQFKLGQALNYMYQKGNHKIEADNYLIIFNTFICNRVIALFYAPTSIDQGHSFWPARVSVCLSAKTLTLAISFNW